MCKIELICMKFDDLHKHALSLHSLYDLHDHFLSAFNKISLDFQYYEFFIKKGSPSHQH
jgi:hypothetical protein